MKKKKKICVVTGGARGIGRNIVEAFVKYGAEKIYACDVNAEALEEIEREFDTVVGYSLDVTDPDAVAEFAKSVTNDVGRIDVLVNNAGITRDEIGRAHV